MIDCELKHACKLVSSTGWSYFMRQQSPVAALCELRGNTDYRMNGMDWKATDTTLSHAGGMWWTCRMIITLSPQKRIHVGAYINTQADTHSQGPKCTLNQILDWQKHVDARDGRFSFKKVKIKVLTQTKVGTHVLNNWWWCTAWGHTCQSDTKGWSVPSDIWHWHMFLCVYL